jgi:hypothetical protein
MRDGEVLIDLLSVEALQRRAMANLHALPARYRVLRDPEHYPVHRSAQIHALRERARREHGGEGGKR